MKFSRSPTVSPRYFTCWTYLSDLSAHRTFGGRVSDSRPFNSNISVLSEDTCTPTFLLHSTTICMSLVPRLSSSALDIPSTSNSRSSAYALNLQCDLLQQDVHHQFPHIKPYSRTLGTPASQHNFNDACRRSSLCFSASEIISPQLRVDRSRDSQVALWMSRC